MTKIAKRMKIKVNKLKFKSGILQQTPSFLWRYSTKQSQVRIQVFEIPKKRLY